ncbi:MAG: thioredoxin fold domain-containing protein [Candidatus Omnitrophica bacterium]|nr:thioredoxin fold domain-containing protein [Candidatus Omnitrophota bacterium]
MEVSPLAFLGIFLTGLALNLTPCVYPMLSVTVALFGQNTEKHLGAAFTKALVYVAGIVFMYSLLGGLAALTGGFFGATLQSPWVLISISVLMFILALSMFGLYEFRLPPALVNWVGGNRRAGNAGIFLSGLFVGIFAAPCIGPPIVALLTLVGQSASPASGFSVFFVLALGLGAPYLVLGTFSGLLSKLPKSGEWLVWIKKIFGVALIGLALFYLTLALYSDFLSLVVPITLIGGGVYLGFFDPSGNKKTWFLRVKQSIGSLAVIAGILILFGKPIAGVVWEPYSGGKVKMAKEMRKPVVIDFYADWCIPCHELERYTYSNQAVIQALEPFVRLKVDATNPNTKEALEPIEKFDVIGVPTILFLDPDGKEVPEARITGYVPPAEFLKSSGTVVNSTD